MLNFMEIYQSLYEFEQELYDYELEDLTDEKYS
jgi:hypothetical protein